MIDGRSCGGDGGGRLSSPTAAIEPREPPKIRNLQNIEGDVIQRLSSLRTASTPIPIQYGGLKLLQFSDHGQGSEMAKKVGEVIEKSCVENGITKVAFDRAIYTYHGFSCFSK
ncbi:unnamed protein product [Arabidopsis thaliana]|uniref:Uncharacterized protein n=1 Tax=Arabidopsis thaliana TaxID=3702 RepID=A0A5S9XD30_ARATH|nr:unnamed protein product [Arabidopsis thaliana]